MDLRVDVRNKVAVITGGTGVLCSSMAKALAREGAKVAVLGRRLEEAERIVDEIISEGGIAIGVEVDVLQKDMVIAARDQILKVFGTIDILINGAGGNSPQASTSSEKSFFDLTVEGIQQVLNLNFLGTVIPTQVFGEVIAENKKGVIINISSMAAHIPLTKTIAYSAAKAAISNFTQWMAVHFNQEYSKDIRVNAIAPGFLLTNQNKYLLTDEATGGLTERGKAIINGTPMEKFGAPEDLIGIVLFLCSDAASFINGAIIPVDGAFSAFSGV